MLLGKMCNDQTKETETILEKTEIKIIGGLRPCALGEVWVGGCGGGGGGAGSREQKMLGASKQRRRPVQVATSDLDQ